MVEQVIGRAQGELDADEQQQRDDGFVQMDEITLEGFQYKVHGPQPQNGEQHGRIDDQRLTGNCDNGGHGVERKQGIGHLDDTNAQKQGRGKKCSLRR